MKVATAEQMKQLDRKTIEIYGVPGIVLMENAGRAAAASVLEALSDLEGNRVGILAGKGNNGGDAFVAGRHLLNRGIVPRVYLLADSRKLRGDAATNYSIFTKMGGEVVPILSSEEYQNVKGDLRGFDLLVDGIFGTGLDAEVGGHYREIIDDVNRLEKFIAAIDIPSGLDADTGRPLGTAIRASLTVTFGLPKIGHLLPPGPEYVGELKVIDIGIPTSLVEEESIQTYLLTEDDVIPWVSLPRRPDTHKGDYGHLLVIAGSVGKTGAAAMACEAALRMGAGLVTLGIPMSLNPIMEMKLTEAMTEPLPETDAQSLGLDAYDPILRLCEGKRAVVIGPGIGRDGETRELILKLIKAVKLPMVIDADGITALAGRLERLSQANAPVVLTPHPGEMARLIGGTTRDVQSDRLNTARNFSRSHRIHLVLKGDRTLIAGPEGDVFINPTGNPGMASGGTGDVLTGMIGGLICQGFDILPSVQAGVFLHGMAGDRVASELGEKSLLATDLIGKIPGLLRGN